MTKSSSLESFEATLKEAVSAKRLSVNTMKDVTNIAIKNMENDTQLVSILYRTHKTLSPASKIHSLYVFDSLSRAARHQVEKQGLSASLNSERGNCATFLLKVEGVLDGLFQDMVSSGSESKEKAKKILDIWIKSNTFPSAVLARLHKLVKERAEKDLDNVTATPAPVAAVDPRPQSHNQTTVATPPQATPPSASSNENNMQATLLALLTKAASAVAASNGQTTTNIPATAPISTPGNTTEPFALLQQLTQVANAGNTHPTQPIPVPVSLVPSSAPPNAVPPVTAPVGGPSQPPPFYRDDHNGFPRKEPQYDRYGPPDRGREYHDDRRDQRGPYRGGHRTEFRGDHRGGYRGAPRGRGRGRWDDHDRRVDRNRDQDWGPPARHRTGRSRSPPHARLRQERSPHSDSPSQQGAPVFRMPDASESAEGTPAAEDGKDEFGRDLRPSSPRPEKLAPPSDQLPRQSSVPQDVPMSLSTVDPPSSSVLVDGMAGVAPQTSPIPTVAHSPPPTSAPPVADHGLESFDLSAFDLTAPSSWEALAHAWKVTHGYMPQQEELMQYIMAANTNMTNVGGNAYPQGAFDMQQNDRWSGQEQGWGNRGWRGRGRGRGRARGGYGYGNSRGSYPEQETDALTLTGGDDEPSYAPRWQNPAADNPDHGHYPGANPDSPTSGGTRAPGRMQKIGDKWVFVKGDLAGSEDA